MDSDLIKSRASQVVRVLSGLDLKTGMLVLSEALKMAVEQTSREVFGSVKIPVVKRRVKSERHLFKVERDQAIMDFIHAQGEPLSCTKLLHELIERYGAHRAPSRSALHRYLQFISSQGDASS